MNIYVVAPLDWNLSKNKKFVGKTKKVLNPEYRKARQWIYWKVFQEKKNLEGEFAKGKVWIKIKVYKQHHYGDCINLLEGICDSVKEVIGIDDRYFSAECDWFICNKEDEKIIIEVIQ